MFTRASFAERHGACVRDGSGGLAGHTAVSVGRGILGRRQRLRPLSRVCVFVCKSVDRAGGTFGFASRLPQTAGAVGRARSPACLAVALLLAARVCLART